MGNKKVLSKATRELNKTKRFATPKNIIEDPRGQWDHPGEITRIPSDRITMQDVPYPVMAYPNIGEPQMMYPEQEYYFPGADYVDEYPQMQEGGSTIPIVEDAGSMNEDGFWIPDWEAIAMQAKQLNAKTVKTKSGAIIYFDNNWQVKSVDDNPQMKRGGTPKSLVKMPKPSKKGLASKKFSRSLEATNRLFTEHPLFAKSKSKKRKVFDPNAVYQDGGIMDQEEPTGGITSQEEIDAANRAMMRARLAYAQMHGNPAAERMVVAPDQPYEYTGDEYDQLWGQPVGAQPGMIGTHYMASFDNYAVPFIQQGPNGLYFNEAPSVRDREAIRFDSEEDAEYFGGHYKEVAPDKSYRRKIENGSPYITSLSPEDEEQFQRFYSTLPENLQSDDPSYDIRGYWDSEGRPEEFDYSQPKEDDGYYHAYSINQNTGEYLKNPWHPTFQHAVDEDRKIGYRPVVNVKGELIATENPSIADPEEQTFLRSTEGPANYIEAELTPEEIEEYRKGGYIIEDLETYPRGGGLGKGKRNKEPKKVEPFVTSDPEEYAFRKAAYNDSLRLYKAYQMQDKLMGPASYTVSKKNAPYKWNTQELKKGRKKTYDKLLKGYYAEDYQSEKDQFKKGYNDWSARKADQELIKYYKSLGFTDKDIMYHSSPDVVSDKIRAIGSYNDGTAVSPIYKEPVQPIIFKPESEVHQYPTEYKPVVNNIPPGISKSDIEKSKVVVGDKVITGYQEEQQLDPKTGKVTTVINPIYETVVPPTVNPELQKFVEEKKPEPPRPGTDIMPVYDTDELPMYATPDPDAEWVGNTERYVDWSGNKIPYRLPKFRKPGHSGDLVKPGKRRYIPIPSIETRYQAEIIPEEEYAKGGYIIEDISVPSLNKMQDGGIVQLDGYRFKKDDSGNWFYESGAPVTDRALVQRLTYESKPVGSPVVQNAPRPRVNQAVWENAAGTSQKNAIAREKQLQALKASPVRADQEKAAQIEQQRAASEAEYMNQLRQSSQYEQPLDMMDWLWGAAAIGPTIAPAAWAAAETAGTAAMPYINAAFNTIPGQLVSSGLAADAIVNRLYPSAGKIQEGKYGEAAGDIATGLLDLWGANMLSPIYKGAKATASELGRFIGTEEGLLSNTYKYNPWAFKPNPEAYYRMIGNEGYADALESGVLRSNPGKGGLQKQEFDDVYFSMKHPWDGRNYGYVTKSGEPIGGVGYTGPYMAELTGQELNHPISSFPRANMAQSKVPISLENPNLKLYKQDWLRGYKEVPKELPGSPNSSFSIFPKKPVPLQGYDLSKGQAYKTIYSNPEHNWHNQSYKDLYDQMLRDLEQQKKLSDELAGFDPLDKMNNSVVSNEAYKNLLMGEDLKWKIDDDLTTPRIPFNKSGQRAEGVRFNPRVQYKPMDPLTRAYMLHNYRYGLNNMYRTERLLPSVQTLRNLPKWTIPLDAKTFSIEMRNKIINPRTGKPITLENIERASPKQLELWKQQGIKKMQRELMDDIELQSLMPKYDPRDFNINQNKEGGMVLELTDKEIKKYMDGGWIIEEM